MLLGTPGQIRRKTMKRNSVRLTILIASILAVSVLEARRPSIATVSAQAPGRSLPTFQVDRAWPKVPPQWKLGDPSSIAIDAQDHVWVLHRPRTLVKPDDAAKTAPPVTVFGPAGTLLKAWSERGHGYDSP